jgi:hypothetical protein
MLRKIGQVALVPAALLTAAGAEAASIPGFPPLTGLATVYRLNPVARGTKARRNVCCTACHLHAQNKYFASAEAANALRAHRGCDCAIIAEQIPMGTYQKMFLPIAALGGRLRRVQFDMRWS